MAGAMRKMGIYLGLVEDDDRAGYDRYAARQSGYEDEPAYGHGRYAADAGYDDYERDYPEADHFDEPAMVPEPAHEREPALPRRPASAVRPLGLAPNTVATVSGGSPASGRVGGGLSGATAAGLAVREPAREPVREPVVQAVPSVATAAAPAPAPAPPQPYRITTLHPRTYNEARQIGERFREGLPVIMNLTEMDDADAKRLVDFAAGLSFGLRGSIERVTAKVFLISPQNIDVTAEDKARIREGGFFNQS
jgi:cell division inhibitor SepF